MPTKKKLPAVMRGDVWPYRFRFSNLTKVCDGAASTSAPTKVSSPTAAFTSASLDLKLTLAGAGEGGEDYTGRITAIDSGTIVTVCPSIETTVSNAELAFGVGEDVSGDTLTLTLKSSNSDLDAAAALQHSVTFPSNAESAAGIGFLEAPIVKTALVGPATYLYDFQRKIGGSSPVQIQTPLYGEIPVIADTTLTV